MITEWNDKQLLAEVDKIMEGVAKEGAGWVRDDAKKILISKSKRSTGKLASQIEIKISKFKNGGYIVQAQGSGNYDKYYASFVELGTHKMKAIPFLRPALARNKRRMYKAYKDRLK